MKFSLNQIRTINVIYKSADDPAALGLDALLDTIGAQLGGVDEVTYLGDKYKGAVIVNIVNCQKHEGSDHLNVCRIDDGGITPDVNRDEQGYVQVVCGAANVRAGLRVVWLPPGSTVPESYGKEPFVLGSRELRGVISNGMLASPRELAVGDNHDGILEINDPGATPGTMFGEKYGLDGDVIIDIENKMLTHRPDCFGYLGIARELAGIQGQRYTSPEWYSLAATIAAPDTESLPLSVQNEVPEAVPRFAMIALAGVEIKPSPMWLQVALARVGMRSINNIVDYTNFFMLETSQPLHAYDYDKVRALGGSETANIIVRYPRSGEKITLLNGKEITPRPEAIMIASESKLIGIGGVMGGADTEVDASTKNIILEAATFDMYSVRRTSMAHGLFTDAVTRFSKGQSPLQNVAVLAKIAHEICEFAAGTVASKLVDINQLPGRTSVYTPVTVSASFINKRLGFALAAAGMQRMLENVEFVVSIDGESLKVTAPFWRTDIETREDVVEEVGRLYGYDKLPLELPRRSVQPVPKNPQLDLKRAIRESLARSGANEVLSYSFVHGDLLRKVDQNPAEAFQVSNALSPDLQYFRLHALPSLLDKVHMNLKAGYPRFALFELNKGHNLRHTGDAEGGVPTEIEFLDFVYAADAKQASKGAAFYEARAFLDKLAADFGLSLTYAPITEDPHVPVAQPYDLARSAYVSIKQSGEFLGMVGEFKASVTKKLKLPRACAGFTVGWELFAGKQPSARGYHALSRYPKVTQDITLEIPAAVQYQQLYDSLQTAVEDAKPVETSVTLEPLDIYQSANEDTRRVTFRVHATSYQKTMTDKQVSQLLDSVAAVAQEALQAKRI